LAVGRRDLRTVPFSLDVALDPFDSFGVAVHSYLPSSTSASLLPARECTRSRPAGCRRGAVRAKSSCGLKRWLDHSLSGLLPAHGRFRQSKRQCERERGTAKRVVTRLPTSFEGP